MQSALKPEVFRKLYNRFRGAEPEVERNPVQRRQRGRKWDRKSTYIQEAAVLRELRLTPGSIAHHGRETARDLRRQRDHRPHLAGRRDQEEFVPAGFLSRKRRQPVDFNSYGSRRGNDRIMTRGTFANVRIKNLMLGGGKGGNTVFWPPAGENFHLRRRDGIPADEHAAHRDRSAGIRHGFIRDWAAKGHEPARRESRRRAELRAHPPQQPRRHGRAAVYSSGRHDRANLKLDGSETYDVIGLDANIKPQQDPDAQDHAQRRAWKTSTSVAALIRPSRLITTSTAEFSPLLRQLVAKA